MRIALLYACLIGLPIAPSALDAQEEPVAVRPTYVRPPVDSAFAAETGVELPSSPARAPSCWRARWKPCPGFFLTEFGVEQPLASTKHVDTSGARRTDFAVRAVWTFGFLGTKGRHSNGVVLSLRTESAETVPFALEWRYRNWLSQRASIDAGLGYQTNQVWEPGVGLVNGRGVTAMIGFTPSTYVGFSLRTDVIRARHRDHRALMIGVQSTRLSEVFIKYAAIGVARALLAKIGIELETEDN
jgi:hypothetical protein